VLEDHVKHLDGPTTYHLMLMHGRIDVLLYYAHLKKDFHRVISYYIQVPWLGWRVEGEG
jgi:hypothetical protein